MVNLINCPHFNVNCSRMPFRKHLSTQGLEVPGWGDSQRGPEENRMGMGRIVGDWEEGSERDVK